jgi:paraquat-inducible protein B
MIALTMEPNAKPATVTREGDALVLPSNAGGLDSILSSVSDITSKISKMPLQQIAENVNNFLVTANHTIGGPQVKQSLNQLNATLKTANSTLQGVNQSYGRDSDFQQSLSQVLQEADEALRSVKLLADYLNKHPQALLLGRSGGQ